MNQWVVLMLKGLYTQQCGSIPVYFDIFRSTLNKLLVQMLSVFYYKFELFKQLWTYTPGWNVGAFGHYCYCRKLEDNWLSPRHTYYT